jgi:hypothetical protein
LRTVWNFKQRPGLRSLLGCFNLSHGKNIFIFGHSHGLAAAASYYLLLQDRLYEFHRGAFVSPMVAGDKPPFASSVVLDLWGYCADGFTIQMDQTKRDLTNIRDVVSKRTGTTGATFLPTKAVPILV